MSHKIVVLYDEPSIRKFAKSWNDTMDRAFCENSEKLVFVRDPDGTRRPDYQRARLAD